MASGTPLLMRICLGNGTTVPSIGAGQEAAQGALLTKLVPRRQLPRNTRALCHDELGGPSTGGRCASPGWRLDDMPV